MSQGSSVKGLLVAGLQLQRRVTVASGLLKTIHFQEADGSGWQQQHSTLDRPASIWYQNAGVFECTAPVGVEGALVRFEGETFAVLVQSRLKVALLHQVIALTLQQSETGFLFPGCGADEPEEAVSGGGNTDNRATVLQLFIIVQVSRRSGGVGPLFPAEDQ